MQILSPVNVYPVNVYFKEAWTENTKVYKIYPDWTLNQFRDTLKPIIAQDFNLAPDAFEIVEAGKNAGENDQALAQSNDIRLQDLFNFNSNCNLVFYIRRL